MKANRTLKLTHKLPLLVIGTAVSLILLLATVSTARFETSAGLETLVFLGTISGERSLALTRCSESIEAIIVTLAARLTKKQNNTATGPEPLK